jgi:hypothetical protein
VEGIPDPVVASRTQETILEEMELLVEPSGGRTRRNRGPALSRQPQLFEAGE